MRTIDAIHCLAHRVPAVLLFSLLCLAACKSRSGAADHRVVTGLERLAGNDVPILQGKRVGVITNQTGRTAAGRHIADILAQDKQITLAALFGPEHGIRGEAEAGAGVSQAVDEKTGVPIFSLYGNTRKPTADMLLGVDALVFDIQDVGTRFYTYISTMSLAMEAAAEAGIPFIVLDRPNPIGGEIVEGPMLSAEERSFVGIQPIPLRHGMTLGELAWMFNEEHWLANGVEADLSVITMNGWEREMTYEQTGQPWIPPSPNMPRLSTALLYPGMGLLEATNFSEGRGTTEPFEVVGAPWADSRRLIDALEQAHVPGVAFSPATFTPVNMPGVATNPKYMGERCNGVRFNVINPGEFRAVSLGIHLLVALQKLYPAAFKIRDEAMARLSGQEWFAPAVREGMSADEIIARSQKQIASFESLREKYLLY